MINECAELIRELGFPIFIACWLIWDKTKTNGQLIKVVENNNRILKKIERTL